MQQASSSNLMVNPSGNTESPMASPSCPMPASSHQVPQQPEQLQQIQQQQQQIQELEAAMIAQQYALYGYMVAMQSLFPASAMTPLQSAASNAVRKHHIKSPGFPYSKSQIAALNERFDQSDSIRVAERREMSKRIGLTERQIKVWFQNRRFKLNKIKKAQSEAQMREQKHHDDTVDSGEENVE